MALAGCPHTPTPAANGHVLRLVIVNDVERPIYLQGAGAWRELGLETTFVDRGLAECPRKWWLSTSRCQLTIGITRVDKLRETEGTNASANRDHRAVRIDAGITRDFEILTLVAHEIGHVVLDTPRHTVGGVMGGADWVLHDVDRQLACETTGICRRR